MNMRRLCQWLLCFVVLSSLGCGQGSRDGVMEEPDDVAADVVIDRGHWVGKALRGEVVINDSDLPVAYWGRDRYVIETRRGDALVIEGDALAITLSYSGGCEDHEFTLVASDAFAGSYPVQLEVALAHEANGDRCQAYLTETYDFDLTPIRKLYQEAYQEDAGTIVLLLPDVPEDVPDLIYTFESQG